MRMSEHVRPPPRHQEENNQPKRTRDTGRISDSGLMRLESTGRSRACVLSLP